MPSGRRCGSCPTATSARVAKDLKKIHTAVDRDHAEAELERFAETWDPKYPMISASWIENWERIVPFLAFPPDVRRAVYTTNTIEALNPQIRKIIKTRGSFPSEDSAASCSTRRSPAPNRNGGTPTTGAQPSQHSASTSATASPTLPDCHCTVTVTH
jgi:transposase-like protein